MSSFNTVLLLSSFFLIVEPYSKIPPEQLYSGNLFDSPATKTCAKNLFNKNNDEGCDTSDDKIKEAVIDYLCRYGAGDVLFLSRRKQKQKPKTTTNCYCCGFIFRYLELGEVCTAYCDYSGEGEKIKGREPLINLPFNWGDECPQAKLDGDRNELPLGSCDQVSPRLKTSTIKPPTASTLRSIQTTKRIKKATTSQRTTTRTKSPTRASLQLSDQLVFATTTSEKQTTTTKIRIFQNQRYASKRPSLNQGTDNLFSGALLITTPSVISQPSTTTSTTIKKKLATTKLPKINIKNVKKASTLSPQPHFNKPEADAPDSKDRIWSK